MTDENKPENEIRVVVDKNAKQAPLTQFRPGEKEELAKEAAIGLLRHQIYSLKKTLDAWNAGLNIGNIGFFFDYRDAEGKWAKFSYETVHENFHHQTINEGLGVAAKELRTDDMRVIHYAMMFSLMNLEMALKKLVPDYEISTAQRWEEPKDDTTTSV